MLSLVLQVVPWLQHGDRWSCSLILLAHHMQGVADRRCIGKQYVRSYRKQSMIKYIGWFFLCNVPCCISGTHTYWEEDTYSCIELPVVLVHPVLYVRRSWSLQNLPSVFALQSQEVKHCKLLLLFLHSSLASCSLSICTMKLTNSLLISEFLVGPSSAFALQMFGSRTSLVHNMVAETLWNTEIILTSLSKVLTTLPYMMYSILPLEKAQQ